ncbi:MAG: hypothetical protein ACREYC_27750 [Gammaproteobacteria bacterium]
MKAIASRQQGADQFNSRTDTGPQKNSYQTTLGAAPHRFYATRSMQRLPAISIVPLVVSSVIDCFLLIAYL